MRMTRIQAALPNAITVSTGVEAHDELLEGARAAVSALYQQRGEEFFHYAMGLGRNEELARDAVQEAFMRYFITLYDGAEIAAPRAWVYRVLHNYLLDRLKQKRSRDEMPLDHARNHTQPASVENDCFRKQVLQRVRRALTEREFDCFRLRSEGLQYEEIAAELHVASGTVGTLLCRAGRKLRSILGCEERSV